MDESAWIFAPRSQEKGSASKLKGQLIHTKGNGVNPRWKQGRVNQGKQHCKCIYACIFILYMLSANNIDLCLGYK